MRMHSGPSSGMVNSSRSCQFMMAVWCLGRVGEVETLARREDLRADTGPVRLYRNRRLEDTTVGRLTGEVLEETAQRV